MFPPPERPAHESKASEAGVLSGQVTLTTHRISDVYYSVHTKRDAREGDPQTMRVDYKIGWHECKSEWVCFEHSGFARQKAIAWWKRRSPDPVTTNAHFRLGRKHLEMGDSPTPPAEPGRVPRVARMMALPSASTASFAKASLPTRPISPVSAASLGRGSLRS
jgi:hypothetical protein